MLHLQAIFRIFGIVGWPFHSAKFLLELWKGRSVIQLGCLSVRNGGCPVFPFFYVPYSHLPPRVILILSLSILVCGKYTFSVDVLDLAHRYLHSDVAQYTDPSSQHRLARVKQLPPPTDSAGVISILGDTGDPQYPIFRTATPPDSAATIATGNLHML